MSDIISVHDLNLWYGNHQALHHINMEIPEKSITAFIGPSGCGKSTLLKTLNRMNDLVKGVRITGNVFYLGQDIYAPEVEVSELRRQIGMVFQKPNPFPMSIYDNVAYGPKTHGIRKKAELDEIVERSLRDAAIWDEVKDRLRKNALGLSGGQQQRLCIARALAVEPNVLLMDEPTSALDPISTSKIEELAMELKEKYTIVIVTHNMQQAVRISDQTAFFLLGELIEYSNTEQLFSAQGEEDRGLHHGEVRIMRSHFDEQLAQLSRELTEMGALCEEVIALSAKALTDGDKALAARVAPLDAEIDQKERDIESLCLKLLLQQQPVARDLRQISAALKMITDMERIGDQAEDIAEIITYMDCECANSTLLREMAKDTIKMVTESVDAYVRRDTKLAKLVIAEDDIVDDYFAKVKKELIAQIAENPAGGEQTLDFLMIAKYFERIGDHAVNIAEWVIFSVTGVHKNSEIP